MKRKLLVLVTSGLAIIQALLAQSSVTMAAGTAVTSPSSACLACAGSTWNNETNVSVADGNPADVSLMQGGFCFQSTCYYSRFLACSQFGFSIPGTATIVGIEVTVLRQAPSANIIKDSSIRIWQNGTTPSLNYNTTSFWPFSYTSVVYGGPTDLWGLSWTPADLNNAATALFFRPYNTSGGSVNGVNVDYVSMTVYYSPSTGIVESQTSSPNAFAINQLDGNNLLVSFSNTEKKSSAKINIIDLNGKLVATKELGEPAAGIHKETISIEHLQAGIYFAQFSNGEKAISKKIIIQK